jgi:penicillin-binding protein 1A
MFAQYGEQTYTRGLKVYTTIKADDQQAAYDACAAASWTTSAARPTAAPKVRRPARPPTSARRHRRRAGRPPRQRRSVGRRGLEASERKIEAVLAGGDTIEITGDGLRAPLGPVAKAAPAVRSAPAR